MEWHEKKFGWLWKNVGGHFPCLFHDLYVNFIKTAKKIDLHLKEVRSLHH